MTELGLIDIADALGQLESEKLRVYPLQCVRLRHRKSQCTLCADHCPTGAIIWGNSLQINVEKCTECGLCAAVCPTGVFEASNPSNQELLAQINELAKVTSTIAFACPSVTGNNASGVIRVSCLGRLDASILVGAAAAGILQVDLVDSACTRCPDRIGHVVAEQAITESNALLQACGIQLRVSFKPWSDLLDQPAHKSKQINPNYFEGIRDEIHHVTNQLPKGELPVRVPVKKHLLLSSLQNLAVQGEIKELTTSLWATVSINPSCTGCQMCAFFCPTGALVKTLEDGKPGLVFKYADCTNCQLCRDVCYMASINLTSQVDLNKVLSHASDTLWSDIQTSSHKEKMKRLKMFKWLSILVKLHVTFLCFWRTKMDIQPLLEKSSRDHAHLCPRQILGVRLGLLGIKALGFEEPPEKKRVLIIIETDGCFADGVSAATDCTVGHRTLRVEDFGKTAAVFVDTKMGQALRVAPVLNIREKAYSYAPGEPRHYFAQMQAYQIMPDEEMFTVNPVVLSTSIKSIVSLSGVRVNCDLCGEEIMNEREVEENGLTLCRACAGSGYYQITLPITLAVSN